MEVEGPGRDEGLGAGVDTALRDLARRLQERTLGSGGGGGPPPSLARGRAAPDSAGAANPFSFTFQRLKRAGAALERQLQENAWPSAGSEPPPRSSGDGATPAACGGAAAASAPAAADAAAPSPGPSAGFRGRLSFTDGGVSGGRKLSRMASLAASEARGHAPRGAVNVKRKILESPGGGFSPPPAAAGDARPAAAAAVAGRRPPGAPQSAKRWRRHSGGGAPPAPPAAPLQPQLSLNPAVLAAAWGGGAASPALGDGVGLGADAMKADGAAAADEAAPAYSPLAAGPPPLLPLVDAPDCGLPSISHQTLATLLLSRGAAYGVRRFIVVDARFGYEFRGGRVAGAVHADTPAALGVLLAQRGVDWASTAVVLHCEFSSERAPRLFRHFRGLDRRRNLAAYPTLDWPHLVVLEGGFRRFAHHHPQLCEPPGGYVPMDDPAHAAELRACSRRLKAAWAELERGEPAADAGAPAAAARCRRALCGGSQ